MIWRIGTRGSRLALIQAGLVRDRLAVVCPEDSFELVVIKTRGDLVTDRPIAALGDNALFTREIERTLLAGEIDLAVHSMKDLPATCAEGLTLARAWTREDPRDVLVLRDGRGSLTDLPSGATVATGSPRRTLLLRRLRPDLNLVDIRGNVDTRLRKLFEPTADEPRLDALVLAAAGLKRLGRADVISEWLDPTVMIPAANQGALAIELRADDVSRKAIVDALGTDADEMVAVAERTFLREIGADCHMPIGAFARLTCPGERVQATREIVLRAVFARDVCEEPAIVEVRGSDPADVAFRAAADVRRRLAGTVTLVGAGPGDPELITVRGLAAVRAADVLVYDRLVSEKLLDEARPDCERIYVGKESGAHTLPQDEINALLVRKAIFARNVVRLKGGDPFVFGRGSEEVAYLSARGVMCRTVPGVTSAIAAPEAAGIPVTHRGVASGFEVITGHGSSEGFPDIDFSRLTDERRTLVFLMGLSRLGEIAASLIDAGRRPETPVAVVASATLPQQRCVVGTLADIAERTARAGVTSPAVIVIGDVVAWRGKLGYPLSGKRVLVPEIVGGSGRLANLLRVAGADVDTVTVGRIEVIPQTLDLSRFTWLALTSRNGLLAFDDMAISRLRANGCRVAVLGSATAAAARRRGLDVALVSQTPTGEGLRQTLAARLAPTDVVLHPLAEGAPDTLASLADVCAYEPVPTYRDEVVPIDWMFDLSDYEAVVFTCASSVRRLLPHTVGQSRMLAIGPTTAAALRSAGISDVETAECPDAECLVARLLDRRPDCGLASIPVMGYSVARRLSLCVTTAPSPS